MGPDVERERFAREMREAAGDEMFLADVEEAMRDFAAIDAEAAGRAGALEPTAP